MDICADKIYRDVRRMSEQEYYNKQYQLCDFVAGHRAEQVNNRRYNAGRKSERQQARIGEDISEISGRRVIQSVKSAAELADNVLGASPARQNGQHRADKGNIFAY